MCEEDAKVLFKHFPGNVFGFWQSKEEKKFRPSLLNQVLARYIFWLALSAICIVLPATIVKLTGYNLVDICETLSAFFFGFMVLTICGCFRYRVSHFDTMMTAMEGMKKLGQIHLAHPKAVENRARFLNYLILIYYAGCVTSIVLLLTPVLLAVSLLTRELPIKIWYPYDSKKSPNFELTLLFWMIPYPAFSHILFVVSSFFMSLTVEAVKQYQLLNHNIRHLVSVAKEAERLRKIRLEFAKRWIQKSTVKHYSANEDDLPLCYKQSHETIKDSSKGQTADVILIQELDRKNPAQKSSSVLINPRVRPRNSCTSLPEEAARRDIETILAHCVRHHVAIENFVAKIRDAYQPILMHQVLSTVIPVIAEVVLVTNSTKMEVRLLLIGLIVISILITTAAVCWFTDKIKEESELIRDAVFSCDWLRASDSFKRSMRIIMSRSNQPMVIRVAGFIPLTMETFFETMKLTFSYYKSLSAAFELRSKNTD